jgi:hypothetical protein
VHPDRQGCILYHLTYVKLLKTFEDLQASVIKTFKTYLQDAGKILCVMKKMREDFAITV